MALVAYGSGSETDSDNEKEEQTVNTVESQSSDKLIHKSLNLPSVSGIVNKPEPIVEQELEGVVKPRDWEQQLAEKNRRKLEKKALKKEKKEKKHKKKKKEDKDEKEIKKKPATKIKIQAFGALGTLGAQSDSEEEEETPKVAAARPSFNNSKSTLLSMLPAPKTKVKPSGILGQRSSDSSSLFLPSTLKKGPAKATNIAKPAVTLAPSTIATKRNAEAVEDDSDDGSDGDYFGLNSAPEYYFLIKTIRLDPETDAPATWIGPGHFGPEKPQPQQEMHPSQMYNYVDEKTPMQPQRPTKSIDDEQAYNLISRDETVQVNDRRTLNEITAGIIDFNVDQALGPNVQSDLLKGVTKAAYLRDVQSLPTKKDSADRVARQKHQITYLAKLAVARDEALQDQWAASKNNKRMARQKYGF